MQLQVKPVPLTDLERLRSLSIKTFTEAFATLNSEENMHLYLSAAFDLKTLQQELLNPASRFFYCFHKNEIIGYMKLNFSGAQTDLHDPGSLEIERIYVLREHQNKRAGTYMLGQAHMLARQHDLRYVWLGVWEHNANAIRFYERHGFHRVSKHTFRLGEEEQTDVIMKRPVDWQSSGSTAAQGEEISG